MLPSMILQVLMVITLTTILLTLPCFTIITWQ